MPKRDVCRLRLRLRRYRVGRAAAIELSRPASLRTGHAWFSEPSAPDGPSCLVAGRPASLDEGIERAAQLLAAARYPLVYGLEQTSCEAVRLAVGIADWIGAVLDTASGARGGLAGLSLHGVGEVTCSLGEIANRADLVLVWRANPVVTHPRHFGRYSLSPRGRFVPGGRADRTCIVVDASPTESAEEADLFLPLAVGCDFEALWILRALVRGVELDADGVLAQTGVVLDAWRDLRDRLKRAKFAVILFDGRASDGRAGNVQVDALWALVRDLNAFTRVAAAPLLAGGNAAGAASFVCSRAGAPSAIDFARGYPRFNPGEYNAEEVLARGEVDAVLTVAVGRESALSSAARRHLAATPRVTIESGPTIDDDGSGRRVPHRRIRPGCGRDDFSHGRRAVAAAAGIGLNPSERRRGARAAGVPGETVMRGPEANDGFGWAVKDRGPAARDRSLPATCRPIAARGEAESRHPRNGENVPRRWLRSGPRRNRRTPPRPIPARWRQR